VISTSYMLLGSLYNFHKNLKSFTRKAFCPPTPLSRSKTHFSDNSLICVLIAKIHHSIAVSFLVNLSTILPRLSLKIIYKKLQAIYVILYKRYKTAKIKKYKHEHVLAYTFNLSSVARINV